MQQYDALSMKISKPERTFEGKVLVYLRIFWLDYGNSMVIVTSTLNGYHIGRRFNIDHGTFMIRWQIVFQLGRKFPLSDITLTSTIMLLISFPMSLAVPVFEMSHSINGLFAISRYGK